MTDEINKLRIALAEAQTRERIAQQELQKMRQRAEAAEKKLLTYECSYCTQCKIKNH